MSTEQIDGTDGSGQILAGTVGNAAIAAAAGIASTKLACWSANRNAGGFSLTNLGVGAASNAAATVQQAMGAVSWIGSFGGTANARTATTTPSVTPFAGMQIVGLISAAGGNTGAMTLDVNGSGAVAVQSGGVALVGNQVGASVVHGFTRTAGGLWELFNPLPIFGQGYATASLVSSLSTTSQSFQTYFNTTTPSVPAGTYLVQGFVQMGNSTGNFEVDAAINGNLLHVNGAALDPPQVKDRFNIPFLGVFTLTAGTQTLRIRYRSYFGTSTQIREARMTMWRVA